MEGTLRGIPLQVQTRKTKTELGSGNSKANMGQRKTMAQPAQHIHPNKLQLQDTRTGKNHSRGSSERKVLREDKKKVSHIREKQGSGE